MLLIYDAERCLVVLFSHFKRKKMWILIIFQDFVHISTKAHGKNNSLPFLHKYLSDIKLFYYNKILEKKMAAW